MIINNEFESYKVQIKDEIKKLINNNYLNQAKELIEEYENTVSDDVEIYSIKSVICTIENRFKDAILLLREGLSITPNNFDVLYNLGYVSDHIENYYDAYNYYSLAKLNTIDKEIIEEIEIALRNIEIKYKKKIYNYKSSSNKKKLQLEDINEVVSIHHYGRSGSFFLQSLLDSHPNILMIPGDYLMVFYLFWNNLEEKFGKLIDKKIITEKFYEAFIFIFDANLKTNYFKWNSKFSGAFGKRHNFDAMGENGDKILGVDKDKFVFEIEEVLRTKETISRKDFFIAIHIAYYYALGRNYDSFTNPKILFNPHTYEIDSYLELNEDFKIRKNICMVRDPIQSFGSHIKYVSKLTPMTIERLLRIINQMLYGGTINRQINNTKSVRLEDIHNNPTNTLKMICKFLNIEWNECLLESTFDGYKWWNGKISERVNGFSKNIISKKHEDIFSEYDKDRLRIVFDLKYKTWNYKNDLNITKDNILNELKNPFKFEELIIYKDENEKMASRKLIEKTFVDYITKRDEESDLFEIELLR